MRTHRIGSIDILSYDRFDDYLHLTNVVTTRTGGSSDGSFAELNLGLHVGDDADVVLRNRAVVSGALGIEPEALTLPEQVHGAAVRVVGSDDRGRGAVAAEDAVVGVDALVTNVPGVPLVILVADCAPVSLYDPVHNVIGLAHAGWRGTVAGITVRTVDTMTASFGSNPGDILVGIGPSIGKGHYEVGDDVAEAFNAAFGRAVARTFLHQKMDGTLHLDLWEANAWQLRTAGVPASGIEVSGMCTTCHLDRLYSFRAESGRTGRFSAVLMLHKAGAGRAY